MSETGMIGACTYALGTNAKPTQRTNMLTFTHTVDALPNCPDLHWYSLIGSYLDGEDNTVCVGEAGANLSYILKSLQYYITNAPNVKIVYETIVNKG